MIGMYQLEKAVSLTPAQIQEAMAWKSLQNVEISRLRSYYLGFNEKIMRGDQNHRIPVPLGRKLIKSVLGFMFKEGLISYVWPDDGEDLQRLFTDIFDCNDEETENVRLGRDQARYGRAFEILYVDNDDAHVQFHRVPVTQVVPVYDLSIKPAMWAAVNFYAWTDRRTRIEVYYKDRIERWTQDGERMVRDQVVAHQFGEVPVIDYANNEDGMGDIESILALIDAHDEILANGLDEDGKYADALLLLKNLSLDDEKLDRLIRLRVLEMNEDGEASYLTKQGAYEGREVLRKVIEGLVYSMSGIPNLDDKEAMAQQSGEALKYLYATFEVMVAGDKQSGFTDGLMRRLRLINNFLTWLGQSRSKVDKVQVNWQRNLPSEGTVIVDNVVKLTGIASRRTQLELLQKADYVNDVEVEERRLAEESDRAAADLTAVTGVADGYGQRTL